MFEFSVGNGSERDIEIEQSDLRLRDEEGKKHKPELVVVAGHPAPQDVKEDRGASVEVVFQLPEGVAPAELKYWPSFGFRKSIKYVFR